MILLAADSQNSGTAVAWEWLKSGKSALEAIEQGIRLVEANPADHSVGLGGLPNALGKVELDAGVMDGRTRASGAVGALRGFLHPVSVALAVMQRLPHVLLVGEGAARFAAELGAEGEAGATHSGGANRVVASANYLLAAESEQRWREWCEKMAFDPADTQASLLEIVEKGRDPRRSGGTTIYLARDSAGDLASATSTSGWAWKYPGRLGDSPIAGAGFYADNRYGAAACTGTGELAIRTSLARSAVAFLQAGQSVENAVRTALQDILTLPGLSQPERKAGITLYAITPAQDYAAGYVAGAGWDAPHYYIAVDGDAQPRHCAAFPVDG